MKPSSKEARARQPNSNRVSSSSHWVARLRSNKIVAAIIAAALLAITSAVTSVVTGIGRDFADTGHNFLVGKWQGFVESQPLEVRANKDFALSILVAQLEGDEDSSQTKLILRSLEHALALAGTGPRVVQVLDAGRMLRRGSSSDVYQQRIDAEATGREWLRQAGADVLIWGDVAEKGKALRVFFLLREGSPTRQLSESYVIGPNIALSKDFNEDLGYVIAGQVVAAVSPAYETGKFVADLLDEIYPRLGALAANKVISESPAFCEVKFAIGDVSGVLGKQRGNNNELLKAIGTYRDLIASGRCVTDQNFSWSSTQQPRQCALAPRRARERHGAPRRGGRCLSRGPEGTHARTRAARLGHDPEQPRQCAVSTSASARAARRA